MQGTQVWSLVGKQISCAVRQLSLCTQLEKPTACSEEPAQPKELHLSLIYIMDISHIKCFFKVSPTNTNKWKKKVYIFNNFAGFHLMNSLKLLGACEHAQLCPTLWDPMDLLGSSVHEISQAKILEWFAISFSRGYSQQKDWIRVSEASQSLRGFPSGWGSLKIAYIIEYYCMFNYP